MSGETEAQPNAETAPDTGDDDAKGGASKTTTETKTFTQEQVNSFLAEQKRKLGATFADYDELKSKASKLDEIEQANKTELQKASERAAAAEKRAEKAELASMRSEIARTKNVPASSLTGATQQECEAQADELIAWREQNAAPKRKPAQSGGLKSGASGSGSSATDPKERAAEALRQLRTGT